MCSAHPGEWQGSSPPSLPQNLERIVERALQLVPDGSVVGLGSGRAASAFIRQLGERVRLGLRVRGIPTSEASAALAREVGIPLASLCDNATIDVAVDGADEVDPQNNLIKGLGGAMLREKIVAASAKQFVILVGAEKLVPVLGTHGQLPIEVAPFGLPFCERRLRGLGLRASVRLRDGTPFVTDNGNHILDARVAPIENPRALEQSLRAIPGVVETGLFLGMASTVLIQEGGQCVVR